jgi:hypothetical protein
MSEPSTPTADLSRQPSRDVAFLWSLGLGIGLIVVGLLGFTSNPIVGAPSAAWDVPLFVTGSAHSVLHLVAGAVVLYAALGLTGPRRANLLMGIGVVWLAMFLVCLVSGDLFGLLVYHVNLLDQLLLLVIGGVSVGIGYLSRSGALPGGSRVTGA